MNKKSKKSTANHEKIGFKTDMAIPVIDRYSKFNTQHWSAATKNHQKFTLKTSRYPSSSIQPSIPLLI